MTAAPGAGRSLPPPCLLPLSLGICVLIAALDVLVGARPQVIALLVLGPLLASAWLDVRHSVLVGGWAALSGLVAGLLDGTFLTVGFTVRWCGLLLGCALVVHVARRRAAAEMALRSLDLARRVTRGDHDLAALVESSHDAILATTLDGRITYWNTAAQQLYGYTPQEAIGAHVSMLAPPERGHETAMLLRRLSRGERIEHFEARRVSRTGRRIHVDLTLWPNRTPNGRLIGAYAIARDLEQKRAAAELAQLYEEQRHVALTLQRSLMGVPPKVPGMPTAHRYLPATQGLGVGGDWFDLVPLGARRVGAVIGDVMGRGLEAAAVMGRLYSAAHALAKSGLPPWQVMQTLDAVVADLPDQFITCCYLEIHPDAGEATVCSAGHLPALLVAPDGKVRTLPVPVSVPLGVGAIPHQQVTVALPPGSTLALYTDGLVESPGHDIDTRLDALATALGAALATTPDLEQAADQVLAALLPGPAKHDDDVTLLLTRLPQAPLATAGRELDATPAAVPAGRAFLTDTLTAWHLAGIADDACLLASEILTNAVCHAAGPIRLLLRRTEYDLTIEVTDRSPHLPQPRQINTADESGRGLALVDALAAAWGTRPAEDGKTVWFTLATSNHSAEA
ncbi:hypothetical protein GCM10010145_00620 [Streptomyces ruber]|uniref:protein-serine/threonine phosphatase n=2 Tax=Streptomyces TaxID=1883 RepID=A0A918B8C5_9ACTN|nr:hypothetical protein GCM10010145_00620 [Streptomyces ruber]